MNRRPAAARRTGTFTLFVRYGIGWIMVVAGFVLLVLNPGGFGVEGFSMSVGGGLSVLLLNWMFRLGVSGDRERDREEQARRYLEQHGHWPDEEPDQPPRR
ncbi:MAG: hypothetical protein WAL22_14165 [Solirubrobacteraceae bacterium]